MVPLALGMIVYNATTRHNAVHAASPPSLAVSSFLSDPVTEACLRNVFGEVVEQEVAAGAGLDEVRWSWRTPGGPRRGVALCEGCEGAGRRACRCRHTGGPWVMVGPPRSEDLVARS